MVDAELAMTSKLPLRMGSALGQVDADNRATYIQSIRFNFS
jgi:hypothetical protein